METFIVFVLCPLYVAAVVALVASAFKAPNVFRLIAEPLNTALILGITIWASAIVTMGYCSVSLLEVVSDVDAKAALAGIAQVKEWFRLCWIGAPLVLMWLVLSATHVVRYKLDGHARVVAKHPVENGGGDEAG